MRFGPGRNDKIRELYVWLGRFSDQPHPGFGRGPASLFKVAGFAGHHHVFPVGGAAPGFRQDMVYRENMVGNTTILTGEVVPSQYIFFAEGHSPSTDSFDDIKDPDHRGKWKGR